LLTEDVCALHFPRISLRKLFVRPFCGPEDLLPPNKTSGRYAVCGIFRGDSIGTPPVIVLKLPEHTQILMKKLTAEHSAGLGEPRRTSIRFLVTVASVSRDALGTVTTSKETS